MRSIAVVFVALLALFVHPGNSDPAVVGKAGTIHVVTTLDGDGPGSLRAALEAEGPRLVVFEVGGVIDLERRGLVIDAPFVTVAGQTAPSPGITVIRGGIAIRTHDVLLQHLRVRPGDAGQAKRSGWQPDGIATSGGDAHDIVIDHCSISWAVDENLSASGPRTRGPDATSHRITLSNCIVAEGLADSSHPKGPHSMGSLIHDECRDIAIIGCLYAHNMRRNPLFKAFAEAAVVNNVIYNPGAGAISAGWVESEWISSGREPGPARFSVVGNVLLHGPDTRADLPLVSGRGEAYVEDNLAFDLAGGAMPIVAPGVRVLDEKPSWPTGLVARPAAHTLAHVLAHAGARPADRDETDARIVREALERKGSIIDSQEEVGGYPEVEPVHRALEVPGVDVDDAKIEAWLAEHTRRVETRPNILFCIADDWGYPHAGAYDEPVIETPSFDRLAAEGILFEHAYISSPSCTPSRSAILTGRPFWQLEEAANLHSTLPAKFDTYPELLARAGYRTGSWRKAWGPGRLEPGERTAPPAGPRFDSFPAFLDAGGDVPFCFWLGASDPHRPYREGSGAERGMDLDAIRLPACFPDAPQIRSDIADYFFEVERFDRDVGDALALLETRGLLENTIVVMTGDHGMPFPRGKGNLYDLGARVPLAVRWGARVSAGRRLEDFVSLPDLAPTFLEAAGVAVPYRMSGRSLLPLFAGDASGRIDPQRNHVLLGRERHTPAQEYPSMVGYPSRAIRTFDHLYVWNCAADRWPAGVPTASTRGPDFSDCDHGPTKSWIIEHRDDPLVAPHYQRAFARRPGAELYDLRSDPHQLTNVVRDPNYAGAREALARRLETALRAAADPRVLGGAASFEEYPYYGRIEEDR